MADLGAHRERRRWTWFFSGRRLRARSGCGLSRRRQILAITNNGESVDDYSTTVFLRPDSSGRIVIVPTDQSVKVSDAALQHFGCFGLLNHTLRTEDFFCPVHSVFSVLFLSCPVAAGILLLVFGGELRVSVSER
jgi:hypothetical protein